MTPASLPPDGENPHRRSAERLRALNPPLLRAAADADKRADEWDATFAAGFAAGRAAEPEPHESERIAEWAAREAEPNPYRSQDQIVRDEERQRILAQLDSVEAEEAVVNALMAAVEAGADLGSEARAAITALVGLVERGGTNA